MRILFVHQNFPAQFVHLAPALARRGHDVLALTADSNKNRSPVPVARYRWTPPAFGASAYRLASTFAEMSFRGETVAAAAQELASQHGYEPDVIFGSIGWGEAIFLKEVWPKTKLLIYAEYFYASRGLDYGFDPEYSSDALGNRIYVTSRQPHLLMAVNVADTLVSPTEWQASTFPAYIRDRISVIHDGIDTDLVRPAAQAGFDIPKSNLRLTKADEVVTFINRNHEPHRGFHILMRALPELLQRRPGAHVVIVGGDEFSYSPRHPSGRTWREALMAEVGPRLDLARVHFVGRIPYPSFLELLGVSRVHAYLTYPFVLSWSLLEAMSAGCLVVASRTPPVEEFIQDGKHGILVDFFDVPAWSRTLADALERHRELDGMRAAARQTVVERCDLRRKCLPAMIDLVERRGGR